MEKQPYVYLLASDRNGTLYAGVTSDLIARTWQHREHAAEGFSSKYGVTRLVWYEGHPTMDSAILRETFLRDVQVTQNLDARNNGRLKPLHLRGHRHFL